MPQPINFDEIVSAQKPAGSAITFDDVYAQREAESRVGGRLDVRQGEESIRGQGLPGSPNYQPPMVAPQVEQATESNFGAALKSELVEDPDTRRRLVAESIGVPIERVGLIDDKPVFVNDEGKLQYVSGFGSRTSGAIIANAPEAVGGIVGSFAGSPVVGSTAGAVGARGLKRAIAGAVFDEPQTVSGNLTDLTVEGATNLGAGLAGKGLTALANRSKVVDFSPANRAAAESVARRVKQSTGIDLDLAQASGDRKLISLRAYAARYPGKSAELIQAADEAAEGQFEAATNRVLDMVATSHPSEVAGSAGINAAQMTIAAARKQVSAQVKPLYDAAYAAVPEVTDKKILGMLKLPYFQQAYRDGQRIATLEDRAAGKAVQTVTSSRREQVRPGLYRTVNQSQQQATDVPDLRSLDYTKRALDDKIDSLKDAGKRQEARALKLKRDEFVAAVDAIPNQQWQQARQEYAKLAKGTIEPLENGAIGILAKIKNPKAATAAAKIFQDANVTPSEIAFARAQISKQDPRAWDGLVRQWLGQRFNQALKETQTGQVLNPAGKFRQAVFGTPQDRAKMAAMLPQGVAKDFDDLMFAAERLASTPIAGSNTMRDTEIKEQLQGTGAVLFRWLTSPRQAVVDAAEQRALEQGTVAITEALLDPAKRSQLRRVVKMKPSAQQAVMITTLLGGQASTKAAADEFSDDHMPLSPEQR